METNGTASVHLPKARSNDFAVWKGANHAGVDALKTSIGTGWLRISLSCCAYEA